MDRQSCYHHRRSDLMRSLELAPRLAPRLSARYPGHHNSKLAPRRLPWMSLLGHSIIKPSCCGTSCTGASACCCYRALPMQAEEAGPARRPLTVGALRIPLGLNSRPSVGGRGCRCTRRAGASRRMAHMEIAEAAAAGRTALVMGSAVTAGPPNQPGPQTDSGSAPSAEAAAAAATSPYIPVCDARTTASSWVDKAQGMPSSSSNSGSSRSSHSLRGGSGGPAISRPSREVDLALMSDIKACAAWPQLHALLADRRGDMNQVHAAAALTHLAQLLTRPAWQQQRLQQGPHQPQQQQEEGPPLPQQQGQQSPQYPQRTAGQPATNSSGAPSGQCLQPDPGAIQPAGRFIGAMSGRPPPATSSGAVRLSTQSSCGCEPSTSDASPAPRTLDPSSDHVGWDAASVSGSNGKRGSRDDCGGTPAQPALQQQEQQHAQRPQLLDLVGDLCALVLQKLPLCQARQVANAAWSLSKLSTVIEASADSSPTNAAIFSSSLNPASEPSSPTPVGVLDLMRAIISRSVDLWPRFNAQEVSNLVYSVALVSQQHPQRMIWPTSTIDSNNRQQQQQQQMGRDRGRRGAGNSSGDLPPINPGGISSQQQMVDVRSKWLWQWMETSCPLLPDMSPQAVANCAWSLAQLQNPPAALTSALTQQYNSRGGPEQHRGRSSGSAGVTSLAGIPMALDLQEAHGFPPSDEEGGAETVCVCSWWLLAMTEATAHRLQEFPTGCLAVTAWALSKMQLTPPAMWLDSFFAVSYPRLHHMSSHDLSNVAWAAAVWHAQAGKLAAAAAEPHRDRRASQRTPDLHPGNVSRPAGNRIGTEIMSRSISVAGLSTGSKPEELLDVSLRRSGPDPLAKPGTARRQEGSRGSVTGTGAASHASRSGHGSGSFYRSRSDSDDSDDEFYPLAFTAASPSAGGSWWLSRSKDNGAVGGGRSNGTDGGSSKPVLAPPPSESRLQLRPSVATSNQAVLGQGLGLTTAGTSHGLTDRDAAEPLKADPHRGEEALETVLDGRQQAADLDLGSRSSSRQDDLARQCDGSLHSSTSITSPAVPASAATPGPTQDAASVLPRRWQLMLLSEFEDRVASSSLMQPNANLFPERQGWGQQHEGPAPLPVQQQQRPLDGWQLQPQSLAMLCWSLGQMRLQPAAWVPEVLLEAGLRNQRRLGPRALTELCVLLAGLPLEAQPRRLYALFWAAAGSVARPPLPSPNGTAAAAVTRAPSHVMPAARMPAAMREPLFQPTPPGWLPSHDRPATRDWGPAEPAFLHLRSLDSLSGSGAEIRLLSADPAARQSLRSREAAAAGRPDMAAAVPASRDAVRLLWALRRTELPGALTARKLWRAAVGSEAGSAVLFGLSANELSRLLVAAARLGFKPAPQALSATLAALSSRLLSRPGPSSMAPAGHARAVRAAASLLVSLARCGRPAGRGTGESSGAQGQPQGSYGRELAPWAFSDFDSDEQRSVRRGPLATRSAERTSMASPMQSARGRSPLQARLRWSSPAVAEFVLDAASQAVLLVLAVVAPPVYLDGRRGTDGQGSSFRALQPLHGSTGGQATAVGGEVESSALRLAPSSHGGAVAWVSPSGYGGRGAACVLWAAACALSLRKSAANGARRTLPAAQQKRRPAGQTRAPRGQCPPTGVWQPLLRSTHPVRLRLMPLSSAANRSLKQQFGAASSGSNSAYRERMLQDQRMVQSSRQLSGSSHPSRLSHERPSGSISSRSSSSSSSGSKADLRTLPPAVLLAASASRSLSDGGAWVRPWVTELVGGLPELSPRQLAMAMWAIASLLPNRRGARTAAAARTAAQHPANNGRGARSRRLTAAAAGPAASLQADGSGGLGGEPGEALISQPVPQTRALISRCWALMPRFSASQLATVLWALAQLQGSGSAAVQLPPGFLDAADLTWEMASAAGVPRRIARLHERSMRALHAAQKYNGGLACA